MFSYSISAYCRPIRAPHFARRLAACGLALPFLAQPPHAATEPAAACASVSPTVISRQSDRWSLALAAGQPDAIARLYAEDAVLLASPEATPIVGRAAISSYFADFVARHAQATLSMRAIYVSCNAASDTGNYVYRLTGKRKGTRNLLVGRYSLLYEYRDGEWLIVRQHNQPSPQPTLGLAAR
jgi:uncharacterized protein (TIGR02246 family)